jgi:hypothetical protein
VAREKRTEAGLRFSELRREKLEANRSIKLEDLMAEDGLGSDETHPTTTEEEPDDAA